ncbi:MAG: hypothetical protein KAG14_02915 [Mycoplasmataceae bacterium]|nr:hypothetical protein [Mycoplasmataceae bacterium]
MTIKLKKDILNKVANTSGVAGFANVNLDTNSIKLTETKWENALHVVIDGDKISIDLAILTILDIRSKVISYEITSSIKALLLKNSKKLGKINIFIRGVR